MPVSAAVACFDFVLTALFFNETDVLYKTESPGLRSNLSYSIMNACGVNQIGVKLTDCQHVT